MSVTARRKAIVVRGGWEGHDPHRATDEFLALLERTGFIAGRSFDPWQDPVACPAVWTRKWGAGRVVVVTPGHRLEDLRLAPVRTMIERGITWATR
jgi:type 1 glutamine amidotransferase